jgi:hypothetical protein
MGGTKGKESAAADPEAWSRFERAVDVVAKSPPQHRTSAKPKASQKKRGKSREAVLK